MAFHSGLAQPSSSSSLLLLTVLGLIIQIPLSDLASSQNLQEQHQPEGGGEFARALSQQEVSLSREEGGGEEKINIVEEEKSDPADVGLHHLLVHERGQRTSPLTIVTPSSVLPPSLPSSSSSSTAAALSGEGEGWAAFAKQREGGSGRRGGGGDIISGEGERRDGGGGGGGERLMERQNLEDGRRIVVEPGVKVSHSVSVISVKYSSSSSSSPETNDDGETPAASDFDRGSSQGGRGQLIRDDLEKEKEKEKQQLDRENSLESRVTSSPPPSALEEGGGEEREDGKEEGSFWVSLLEGERGRNNGHKNSDAGGGGEENETGGESFTSSASPEGGGRKGKVSPSDRREPKSISSPLSVVRVGVVGAPPGHPTGQPSPAHPTPGHTPPGQAEEQEGRQHVLIRIRDHLGHHGGQLTTAAVSTPTRGGESSLAPANPEDAPGDDQEEGEEVSYESEEDLYGEYNITQQYHDTGLSDQENELDPYDHDESEVLMRALDDNNSNNDNNYVVDGSNGSNSATEEEGKARELQSNTIEEEEEEEEEEDTSSSVDSSVVIGVAVAACLFLILGTVGVGVFVLYRERRWLHKPRALGDCYAGSDSGACPFSSSSVVSSAASSVHSVSEDVFSFRSGSAGSSIHHHHHRPPSAAGAGSVRSTAGCAGVGAGGVGLENSISHIDCLGFDLSRDTLGEELYNLDNDSFLNSLETMAVPPYWNEFPPRDSDV